MRATILAALGLVVAAAGAVAAPPAPDSAYIRKYARSLPALGRFPDSLGPQLAPYRAILVGEVHGTREAPRLALELARLQARGGRTAWLALEMPVDEQPALDRFRASGDLAILKEMPFFKRPLAQQDGRSSRAIADTLVLARQAPAVPVYAIDTNDHLDAESGKVLLSRDRGMAQQFGKRLEEYPLSVGVALMGKVHARLTAGAPWDAAYQPMGYELTHGVLPAAQVLALEMVYERGTAWNVTGSGNLRTSGLQQLDSGSSGYAAALPWGSYLLQLPTVQDGYNGVLFWRTPTASSPFLNKLP